jgi:hypothetical protein
MKRRSNPEIKNASRVQVAFLTIGVGWAAVSAGPLQERRSRLAQMILPNKIR